MSDAAFDVSIWTDGSADREVGGAGWAAIFVLRDSGARQELSGGVTGAHSQRMELMAAVEALDVLPADRRLRIKVTSDSYVLVVGMTRHLVVWRRQRWRNSRGSVLPDADLWRRLAVHHARHRITWVWVASHSGDAMNDAAHALAGLERVRARPQQPVETQGGAGAGAS